MNISKNIEDTATNDLESKIVDSLFENLQSKYPAATYTYSALLIETLSAFSSDRHQDIEILLEQIIDCDGSPYTAINSVLDDERIFKIKSESASTIVC